MVTITQHVQPLQILTTSLPSGSKGSPYDVFLRGQGGIPPYRWTSGSLLPPGLQLTTAGELKGTPLVAGTFTVSIKLSDSAGTPPATAQFTLTISGQSIPVITISSLPDGMVGQLYPATQLQASGGQPPYQWSIASGGLPAGLQLSGAGLLSGTPGGTGSPKARIYSFQVQVTDAADQSARADFSITIQPVSPR